MTKLEWTRHQNSRETHNEKVFHWLKTRATHPCSTRSVTRLKFPPAEWPKVTEYLAGSGRGWNGKLGTLQQVYLQHAPASGRAVTGQVWTEVEGPETTPMHSRPPFLGWKQSTHIPGALPGPTRQVLWGGHCRSFSQTQGWDYGHKPSIYGIWALSSWHLKLREAQPHARFERHITLRLLIHPYINPSKQQAISKAAGG